MKFGSLVVSNAELDEIFNALISTESFDHLAIKMILTFFPLSFKNETTIFLYE
jgi:hypothetical protein